MEEGFDPVALERLIDAALEDEAAPPAADLAFGAFDTRLFEAFATILEDHLHPGDLQMVLDDARQVFFEGMTVNASQLRSAISRCRRCPAVEAPPAQSIWNLNDPDLVVITDTPLTDPAASELLVSSLKDAGFSSHRVGLTWLTRCKRLDRSAPTDVELGNCRPWLLSELQVMRPKLIMPLGREATEAFIGDVKITEVHGQIFWVGPWAICPAYSPGYARYGQVTDVFAADVRKAAGFVYARTVESRAPSVPPGVVEAGSAPHTTQSGHAGAV